jgi:hypothetical protein
MSITFGGLELDLVGAEVTRHRFAPHSAGTLGRSATTRQICRSRFVIAVQNAPTERAPGRPIGERRTALPCARWRPERAICATSVEPGGASRGGRPGIICRRIGNLPIVAFGIGEVRVSAFEELRLSGRLR